MEKTLKKQMINIIAVILIAASSSNALLAMRHEVRPATVQISNQTNTPLYIFIHERERESTIGELLYPGKYIQETVGKEKDSQPIVIDKNHDSFFITGAKGVFWITHLRGEFHLYDYNKPKNRLALLGIDMPAQSLPAQATNVLIVVSPEGEVQMIDRTKQ